MKDVQRRPRSVTRARIYAAVAGESNDEENEMVVESKEMGGDTMSVVEIRN